MKIFSNKALFMLSFLIVSCNQNNEIKWSIAENKMYTKWAHDVDPLKPWLQYPRPDMVRNKWINLNGLWDYAITPRNIKPIKWDGSILVPYPVESAISGVKKRVSEKEHLWYKRTFEIPKDWDNKHILLNFEACDWETVIWIDNKEVGSHRGGYDPFTFDITGYIGDHKIHELLIRVWDPTEKGSQARGKQDSEPQSVWYTSSTGIWQTVWIEPVNESFISSFRTITNADNGTITFKTDVKNAGASILSFTIKKEGKRIAAVSGNTDNEITVKINNPILWSPENPFLYDIDIELKNGRKTLDKITTYTGLRKISIGKTDDGFTRILLNNKFIWQLGPLDQGFWPDGIYTPPSEEAMINDIEITKKMGFNLLRKHMKVENRLFYYWCDKLGILVWQDMPGGDIRTGNNLMNIEKSKEEKHQFEFELKRMIDTKYNHPSIVMWILFNEGFGQFDPERITRLTKGFDTTRLVNSASGWPNKGLGNIYDIHHYPDPEVPLAEENRAIVLGEFGGLGFPVKGHTWEQKNWGYRILEDTLQLLSRYELYYDQVHRFVKENGLSATIYTQITDVETETNGLVTYDRKVNKMGVENVFRANYNFIPPALASPARIFVDSYLAVLKNNRPYGAIYYTIDGSEPNENSIKYTGPFKLSETRLIKAFTKWKNEKSRTVSFLIEKKDLMAAKNIGKFKLGLKASIYDGNFAKIPDFSTLNPALKKIVTDVRHTVANKDSFFGIVFEGYIHIPVNDVYGLFVCSHEESNMILDEAVRVNNNGSIHRMKEEGGYYPLGQGYHRLRIEYIQREHNPAQELDLEAAGLKLLVEAPGQTKMDVPPDWLFH